MDPRLSPHRRVLLLLQGLGVLLLAHGCVGGGFSAPSEDVPPPPSETLAVRPPAPAPMPASQQSVGSETVADSGAFDSSAVLGVSVGAEVNVPGGSELDASRPQKGGAGGPPRETPSPQSVASPSPGPSAPEPSARPSEPLGPSAPAPPASGPDASGTAGDAGLRPLLSPPEPLSELCGEPGVLLCEDFEGEVSEYNIEGTVVPTGQRAYRGKRSLLADVKETGGRASLRGYFEPQPVDTRLYARGYYYLPSDSPLDTMTLLSFGSCAVIGFKDGLGMWCREGERFNRGLFDIPRDKWFCLRWIYELSESGEARAFIDDTPVVTLTDVDTVGPDGVGWASFPASHSHSVQPPTKIFFDNLVVSNFEVGCD